MIQRLKYVAVGTYLIFLYILGLLSIVTLGIIPFLYWLFTGKNYVAFTSDYIEKITKLAKRQLTEERREIKVSLTATKNKLDADAEENYIKIINGSKK